ncbi:1352_t:CDS:2, partial [Diversispora eburnea]
RRKRNSEIEFKSIEDKHHYLDQPVIPPSPSPTPQQNSIVPTNGIYASALYDFEGKEENELNFRKGDLIEVIEKGDGPNSWWKGNYVVIK